MSEAKRAAPHPLVVVLTYVALALLAALLWQARSGGHAGAPVSMPMILIGLLVAVVSGIVGLVVAAIWGRRVAQAWASGLTLVAACLVMGLRLFERPRLGLRAEAFDDVLMLTQVVPGSAADNAGLQVGDVLVSVDGQRMPTTQALYEYVQQRRVFDVVRLQIVRSGNALIEQDVMVGDE